MPAALTTEALLQLDGILEKTVVMRFADTTTIFDEGYELT
jgi:hypothetical protein